MNLFDQPADPPAAPGRITSTAAAVAIKPKAANLRERVLAAIVAAGDAGMTDDEGIAATDLAGNTYRPRRLELAQAGRIITAPKTRKTQHGRSAVVWIVAQ